MSLARLAGELGLQDDELDPRGRFAVKVSPAALARLADRPEGRLVLVTAMTPTPHGEGKTTTAIGLTDALRSQGVSAIATLRQPALGPLFGKKGGGSGGGRSRLAPREAIDLHLSGDAHAVQAAQNLALSFLDNHLHHGNALEIDPASVALPRVLDLSDRALRQVVIGLGAGNGPTREEAFELTPASEVMAILSLARDWSDLRRRLGRVVVAARRSGELVTLEELRVAGAMAALLRDALQPNLVRTAEGSPALVHTGPFANLSHGCSSVLADRLALKLARCVVTEAGFGADLGGEKFLDIKCRQGELAAAAAVLVVTTRALAIHGAANLAAHLELLRACGLPVVVAVNAGDEDGPAGLEAALDAARAAGADEALVARPFQEGGAGCQALARVVLAAADSGHRSRPLYPDELPLAGKLEVVARRAYGADGVDLSHHAARRLEELERRGFGRLPVCVAKTHLSLSHDPALRGRPRGFRLPVREVRLAAGAGFVTALAGELSFMPGLPAQPAGEAIDLGQDGTIVGLR